MMRKIRDFLSPIRHKKLNLVNEQTSPLFIIMSIFNDDDPQRRKFGNKNPNWKGGITPENLKIIFVHFILEKGSS